MRPCCGPSGPPFNPHSKQSGLQWDGPNGLHCLLKRFFIQLPSSFVVEISEINPNSIRVNEKGKDRHQNEICICYNYRNEESGKV